MKYRLNKAEAVPVQLNFVPVTKTVNGKAIVTYRNYLRLVPGKEYESDDTAMLEWLKAYKRKEKYSPQLESALKANDVPYEVEMCRSCGGKVKKITYHMVEVYDAE